MVALWLGRPVLRNLVSLMPQLTIFQNYAAHLNQYYKQYAL